MTISDLLFKLYIHACLPVTPGQVTPAQHVSSVHCHFDLPANIRDTSQLHACGEVSLFTYEF